MLRDLRALHLANRQDCKESEHLHLCAVLGRFLHSLNMFCHEEYDLEYDISDYAQYDFASVGPCPL